MGDASQFFPASEPKRQASAKRSRSFVSSISGDSGTGQVRCVRARGQTRRGEGLGWVQLRSGEVGEELLSGTCVRAGKREAERLSKKASHRASPVDGDEGRLILVVKP